MTKPTPAQIEVAAKAIFYNAVGMNQWDNVFYAEERMGCFRSAKAALTAAAEVGRPDIEYVEGMPVAISAGPAAAEVGAHDDCGDPGCCPDNPDRFMGLTDKHDKELMVTYDDLLKAKKSERDATIERCAQVAEQCRPRHAYRIAAAIRALKDKP